MVRFRGMKSLQKLASAHASIRNNFDHDRHLNRGAISKENHSAALDVWRELLA